MWLKSSHLNANNSLIKISFVNSSLQASHLKEQHCCACWGVFKSCVLRKKCFKCLFWPRASIPDEKATAEVHGILKQLLMNREVLGRVCSKTCWSPIDPSVGWWVSTPLCSAAWDKVSSTAPYCLLGIWKHMTALSLLSFSLPRARPQPLGKEKASRGLLPQVWTASIQGHL